MIDNCKNSPQLPMEAERIQTFISIHSHQILLENDQIGSGSGTNEWKNMFRTSMMLNEEPLRSLCCIQQKLVPKNINDTIHKFLISDSQNNLQIIIEILSELIVMKDTVILNQILQKDLFEELNIYIKIYIEGSSAAVLSLYSLLLSTYPIYLDILLEDEGFIHYLLIDSKNFPFDESLKAILLFSKICFILPDISYHFIYLANDINTYEVIVDKLDSYNNDEYDYLVKLLKRLFECAIGCNNDQLLVEIGNLVPWCTVIQ